MTGAEPVEPELQALIGFIQESRGIDFRGYKKSSLRRRIQRRLGELGLAGFADYHAWLQAHPDELGELLNTVLINVTSFFRDAEAWEALRGQVVPRLVERAGPEGQLRIWSVGCATGEEPYSLAMAFAEAFGPDVCNRVKIYATDLDEDALRIARQATYAPRDVEGVPPDLLARYFDHNANHYVFQRELRKCVIFGRHNVVNDAPIIRIDLLVCRNLLIYLETETQNQVLQRLHFALGEDALMFLGKAETQLARSRLFEPVDLKHRIFRKVPQGWRRSANGSLTFGARPAAPLPQHQPPLQQRALEALADTTAQAWLAVDGDGTLIFANPAARRLLDVGEGDIGRPFQDLSISYRPVELRSRIEEAARIGRTVRLEHQPYHRPPAEPIRLTIEVMPLAVREGAPPSSLLSFADTTRLWTLQQELEAAQESLEATIEELQSANEALETTNEELQSTNEELETTNEELQSTNEELETMNEELQSTNDELGVVNEAMRQRQEDGAAYQRYAEGVMRSMDAGIIVLDPQWRVRSWNRWNEAAWGLRAEEVVGQDVFSLDSGLPVGRLRAALAQVLAGEIGHAEVVVPAVDRRGRGQTCRVRISPLLYETVSPRGLVLFVEDVTEARQDQDHERYLGRLIGRAPGGVCLLDPDTLRFTLVNAAAERMLGHAIGQLRRIPLTELLDDLPPAAFRALLAPLAASTRDTLRLEVRLRHADGGARTTSLWLQHLAEEQPPLLLLLLADTTQGAAAP
ncbi:CheR family methyltransferase [Falsiroseomonas selenitidurans]|uniref:protein-glutamate O-methyltransferase n=1 Tax=Falsiroseomonas selenitidurans TaxID=2716335 RepID=A0ABX1E2X0_9PROT|nr:CheR family methyltransferase [Falsiroseomonas selenitidurans]NKC31050.1 PAS domain-containing protein [Falsiroseomonas selenitidurans]